MKKYRIKKYQTGGQPLSLEEWYKELYLRSTGEYDMSVSEDISENAVVLAA